MSHVLPPPAGTENATPVATQASLRQLLPSRPCREAAATVPSPHTRTLRGSRLPLVTPAPTRSFYTRVSPSTRPPELLTLAPWLVPIVSEGTFDPELLRPIYQLLNLSLGATVIAVGK